MHRPVLFFGTMVLVLATLVLLSFGSWNVAPTSAQGRFTLTPTPPKVGPTSTPIRPTLTPIPPPSATPKPPPTNTPLPPPSATPKPPPTAVPPTAEPREPRPTATWTSTVAPTPTDTSTPNPTSTASSTPVPSPTATSTATPVPTNTSTATAVPTSTPTSTPTPLPRLHLNELMSNPRSTDWNGDGQSTADDEWIELYNPGGATVNLGGWQLAAFSTTSPMTYTLPTSATIPARGFSLWFKSQTRLDLDRAGGEVQLLDPGGRTADSVPYPLLADDRSFARSIDGEGVWTADCVPTPNARNCTVFARPAIWFYRPFFQEHIADPTVVGKTDGGVLVTNVLLALILALAMGFFGNLLNDAVESSEERMQQRLAALRAMAERWRAWGGRVDALLGQWRLLAGLSFLARLALLLLVYGLVLAFLDPSFRLIDVSGWLLILALALSAGVIGLTDDVVEYVYLRWHHSSSVLRVHSGNLLMVVFTTLFSRVSGLLPGLLIGSPAGIEEVSDSELERGSHLIAVGAIAAITFGAWTLAPRFTSDDWFKTLCLLIFATGVQTLFFEMLPLKYLHGRGVYEMNRVLWLAIFAATTLVFAQTMLNPDGAFVSAFESSNMLVLSLAVIAFCLFSTAVWFYVQHLEQAEISRASG